MQFIPPKRGLFTQIWAKITVITLVPLIFNPFAPQALKMASFHIRRCAIELYVGTGLGFVVTMQEIIDEIVLA